MRRVLLVKLSSMGDVIHTLPALTDALSADPNLKIDWLVEQVFAEIAGWHPAIRTVIPVRLRGAFRNKSFNLKQLRRVHYDAVIDAQGLLKSAMLGCLAKGPRLGFAACSAREPLASYLYQKRIKVDTQQHALQRIRALLAEALEYPLPKTAPDFGINGIQFESVQSLSAEHCAVPSKPYVVLIPHTTWPTKHWPEAYWKRLIKQIVAMGVHVYVHRGLGEAQQQRALQIIASEAKAYALPTLSIGQMAHLLSSAKAFIGVDTGFSHLGAALNVPGVTIYGPTDPKKIGAWGTVQHHLSAHWPCAPCYQQQCSYKGPASVFPACYGSITPERVFNTLETLL